MSLPENHVVVISREGGDFSMDLVWAGLVRRLGPTAVIDYPARAKHRQGLPVLVGDPERDYGAERKSLCYTGYTDFREWTRQEIICHRVEYVFLDETEESYVRYLELYGAVPPNARPRVVVVAGHDRFRGDPVDVLARYGQGLEAMFIDDWRSEYDALPKTHLINLSCNFDHLWDVENRMSYLADKRYDLCFVGYASHPVRKTVIEHLRTRWGYLNNHLMLETRPDEFSAFTRHDVYFRNIAQSRICINLPGASSRGRALRFYEIPYVGSYMLSLRFNAKLLDRDELGVTYFDTLETLDEQIRFALASPLLREQAAKHAHEHCMRTQTVDARMRYVFETLERGRIVP